MHAAQIRGASIEPTARDLQARLEAIGQDLLDIKKMLALVQHRSIAASLAEAEAARRTWYRRIVKWLRGVFRGY